MKNKLVTVSHGRPAGFGFIYGGGYGLDDDLTKHAHAIGDALTKRIPLPVELRGNSDGLSCGAHHDAPEGGYAVGAWRNRDGTISFRAYYHADPESGGEEKGKMVCSGHETPEEALAWLFREGVRCNLIRRSIRPERKA